MQTPLTVSDVYLPDGLWINFFTGEKMEGGKWYYDMESPLELMPVFVHPDTIIKMYPEDVDCTDDMDFTKIIYLEITNYFKGYQL